MRKTTAIAAAALLAVLVIPALAGCGSEKKAREYIEKAREKYKAVAQENEKFKKQYEALGSLGGSTQGVTPEDIAAMRKYLADLVAIIAALDKSSQAVRSEYEKVLDLGDAARYKEFARIEIQKLSLVDRQARLSNDLAAVATKAMDAYAAGQAIDQATIENETKPIVEQRNKIADQINKLNQEATKLAEDLDL